MSTSPPSKTPRLSACTLALAALAGCSTVGTDYERPAVKVPAAYRASAPAPAPAAAADVANTRWWKAFGDPALESLIDDALTHNKDLLIAAARIEQFAARVDVSKAAGSPQVGINANRSRTWRSEEQPALLAPGREPNYNNYAVGATVAWEFDVWGRIARANEAARADLLGSEESRRAVMLKVVSDIAGAYIALLAADEQLAVAREVVKNRSDALALVDLKAKGGSATDIDVARARAQLDEVQVVIPELERQIATGENAVAFLAGRDPGPLARGTLRALKLPPVPQGLPSDLLSRRPDVLAAEQALVAANARIGVAKGQYFPTISLTGALGLVSDQLRWLTAQTARAGEMGAGLAGVLFDGGRIEGDIKLAEATRRQMAETYLLSVQTALREVEDSLVVRAKSDDFAALQARYLQSLQATARLVRARQEGGRATLIDVLEAERQVIAARDREVQGLRDQHAALVSIYKAMGGGWMMDIDKQPVQQTARAAVNENPQ